MKGFIKAIEERGDALSIRGNYFLKEGTPFSDKREVDMIAIKMERH